VAAGIGPVVVACGDHAIAEAVERAGGKAVMTDPRHPTGSDRIAEAIRRLDPDREHDAVINVQGDLPLLDPAAVQVARFALADPEIDIATLGAVITDVAALHDTSVNKGGRRVRRPGAAGARPLFLEGDRAVGRGTALRAYWALRLSPRGIGALCHATRGVLESANGWSSCAPWRTG